MAEEFLLGFCSENNWDVAKVKLFTDGTSSSTKTFLSGGGTMNATLWYQHATAASDDMQTIVLVAWYDMTGPYDTTNIYCSKDRGRTFYQVIIPEVQELLDEAWATTVTSDIYTYVVYDDGYFYLELIGDEDSGIPRQIWRSSDGLVWGHYTTIPMTVFEGSGSFFFWVKNGIIFTDDRSSYIWAYVNGSWTKINTAFGSAVIPYPLYSESTDRYYFGWRYYIRSWAVGEAVLTQEANLQTDWSIVINDIWSMQAVNADQFVVFSRNSPTSYFSHVLVPFTDPTNETVLASEPVASSLMPYPMGYYSSANPAPITGVRRYSFIDSNLVWYQGSDYYRLYTYTSSDLLTLSQKEHTAVFDGTKTITGLTDRTYADLFDDWETSFVPVSTPFFGVEPTLREDVITMYKPYDYRVTAEATPGTPYIPPQCSTTSKVVYTSQVSLNTGYTGTASTPTSSTTYSSTTYNSTSINVNYTWYQSDSSSLGGTSGGFWGPTVPSGYSGVKL